MERRKRVSSSHRITRGVDVATTPRRPLRALVVAHDKERQSGTDLPDLTRMSEGRQERPARLVARGRPSVPRLVPCCTASIRKDDTTIKMH